MEALSVPSGDTTSKLRDAADEIVETSMAVKINNLFFSIVYILKQFIISLL
jgi:hypothetical protein